MTVKRGEVYTADLSGSIGHEQTGTRPVIVIQNDEANQKSSTVVVVLHGIQPQAKGCVQREFTRMSYFFIERP